MLHGYDENYDSRGKASHFTFHGKRKDGQQVVKIPFTNLIRQLIKTVFFFRFPLFSSQCCYLEVY